MKCFIALSALIFMVINPAFAADSERCLSEDKDISSRVFAITLSNEYYDRVDQAIDMLEHWNSICDITKIKSYNVMLLGKLLKFPELNSYVPLMINQVWESAAPIGEQIREAYRQQRRIVDDLKTKSPMLTGNAERLLGYLQCLDDRVNHKLAKPGSCHILDRETRRTLRVR